MKTPISEEQKKEVRLLVEDILPERATILILSSTGSREFGWGSDVYDVDVRAVVACDNYWDTFHMGMRIYDTNLEEMKHFFNSVKRHYWTTFEDLSHPFYLDKGFDFKEFQAQCANANVKNHIFTIRAETAKYKLSPNMRSALHAYRLVMCALYFLRTSKIETNVPKINDEMFHMNYIDDLATSYAAQERKGMNWVGISDDLDKLQAQLTKELEQAEINFDAERYKKWKDDLTEKYG